MARPRSYPVEEVRLMLGGISGERSRLQNQLAALDKKETQLRAGLPLEYRVSDGFKAEDPPTEHHSRRGRVSDSTRRKLSQKMKERWRTKKATKRQKPPKVNKEAEA